MSQTSVKSITQIFVKDFLLGIVSFPYWWYTRGLVLAVNRLKRSIQTGNAYTGVGIWAKNLFVPMYGETQLSGRLISFFMRLTVIVIRGIFFVGWVLIAVIVFVCYLLLLPVSIVGIIYHFQALFI